MLCKCIINKVQYVASAARGGARPSVGPGPLNLWVFRYPGATGQDFSTVDAPLTLDPLYLRPRFHCSPRIICILIGFSLAYISYCLPALSFPTLFPASPPFDPASHCRHSEKPNTAAYLLTHCGIICSYDITK